MGDVKCKQCGEPWDYYGLYHGDVEPSERKMILAGKGCPSCKSKPERKRKDPNLEAEHYASLLDNAE